MTKQLLCPVQNFIMIALLQLVWEHDEYPMEFELRWKIHLWNEPLPQLGYPYASRGPSQYKDIFLPV